MLTPDDATRRLKVPRSRVRPVKQALHSCEWWAGLFICTCLASGDLTWAIRHAIANQYDA